MIPEIKWGGSDLFTHMLVVGPTRCGKTATILKPMIHQLLCLKAKGVPLGISVIEPKGDVAAMVAEMSAEMGLDYVHIDPTLPNSARFNPMEGDTDSVAEATVVVLKGLFGKQEAFFATVQELSARNVTKLLKELHGDNIDITDIMNTLRDEKVLEQKVSELERRDGMTDLVHFFRSELLGSMRDKYRQFVIGLRAQLENITSNKALRKIMTGRSSFSIDEHYEKGGILAVNTALGMLRTSGDAFGQFIIMHLQNGAFRRPGTEKTRVPHFLIVDEYSRYINPDVEIFLNIAAEYRVAGIFAIQSLGQLEVESGKIGAKAMKRAILGGCRNVIVFGGIKSEDANEFAEMFGKDKIIMRQNTYKNKIFVPNLLPDSYRDTEQEEYRFDPTDLMELPRFHFVHRLLRDGQVQQPGIAKGTFVPRDWKERRNWETNKNNQSQKKKMFSVFSESLSTLKENAKKKKLSKTLAKSSATGKIDTITTEVPKATSSSNNFIKEQIESETETFATLFTTEEALTENEENKAPAGPIKEREGNPSPSIPPANYEENADKEPKQRQEGSTTLEPTNDIEKSKKPSKEENPEKSKKRKQLKLDDNFW